MMLPSTPVLISADTPSGGSNDQLQVIYGTSSFAAAPAALQQAMPDSAASLQIDVGIGFNQGDFIVIAQPPARCALLQLSSAPVPLATPNLNGPGFRWELPHAAGYNPPDGANTFPTGGYTAGAQATNLGALVHRVYYVENQALKMRDAMAPLGPNNPVTIASGIVALRAAYGLDTDRDGSIDSWDTAVTPANANQLIAIRYALVARSARYEPQALTSATGLRLWDGGPTLTLRPTTEPDIAHRDQHYRYKVYQTTVPLRNTIWGNG
ncbi:MAG: prepilin-type N-terminal cleavage/methylation protein [Burkholderia sp.]|nr:prepilin-type N-terminal cleavage/methylation protein [Burkholderia sp.]